MSLPIRSSGAAGPLQGCWRTTHLPRRARVDTPQTVHWRHPRGVTHIPARPQRRLEKTVGIGRHEPDRVARDIAREDAQYPAKRHHQVCRVAAHTNALDQHVTGARARLGAPSHVMPTSIGPSADSGHPGISLRSMSQRVQRQSGICGASVLRWPSHQLWHTGIGATAFAHGRAAVKDGPAAPSVWSSLGDKPLRTLCSDTQVSRARRMGDTKLRAKWHQRQLNFQALEYRRSSVTNP
jgi:hypothetical protein